ncbi:hypothetical protein SeMB42_g07083 [Synchytrium endobioticum]|uniref:Dienelactone hydrolase domain-containing protein n=1 Tax=Synchytrium endobioticum TaxID=286115 RepID=A0A507CAC1_9FUNG|nr:hypothetical protein SeMB42_g07083 [Synchytrium endobioticum]
MSGFNNNTKQTIDTLAIKSGLRCVIPDFFRGEGWDPNALDRSKLVPWLEKVGTWDIVKRDMQTMKVALDAEGAVAYAFLGFCWGGKQAFNAATLPWIKASGTAHPAWLTEEDAEKTLYPILLLPSNGEAEEDMNRVFKVLQSKPWGDKSVHVRFGDMIMRALTMRIHIMQEGQPMPYN